MIINSLFGMHSSCFTAYNYTTITTSHTVIHCYNFLNKVAFSYEVILFYRQIRCFHGHKHSLTCNQQIVVVLMRATAHACSFLMSSHLKRQLLYEAIVRSICGIFMAYFRCYLSVLCVTYWYLCTFHAFAIESDKTKKIIALEKKSQIKCQ